MIPKQRSRRLSRKPAAPAASLRVHDVYLPPSTGGHRDAGAGAVLAHGVYSECKNFAAISSGRNANPGYQHARLRLVGRLIRQHRIEPGLRQPKPSTLTGEFDPFHIDSMAQANCEI
jgi:hypothetical protein